MIDYKPSEVMSMTCDYCESTAVYEGSWQECIEDAKKEEWIVRKILEVWMHFCGVSCFDAYRQRQRDSGGQAIV